MIPTLASLLVAQTADQVKATILSLLQGIGFPVTDWNEGSVQRTIIEVLATVLASLSTLIASVAASGFVALSGGSWLTLVAFQVYALTRNPSTFAVGNILLQDNGGGPYTITAGQLTFVAADGNRFTNTAGGTLNLNGTLVLPIRAASPGSAYNEAPTTITVMATPLPTVTCTNPLQLGAVSQVGQGIGTVTPSGTPTLNATVVVKIVAGGSNTTMSFRYSLDGGLSYSSTQAGAASFPVPGSGVTLAFAGGGGAFVQGDEYLFSTSWITTPGTDQETDAALQARCLARWPSLGVAPDTNVYAMWAATASPLVTKTAVVPDDAVPGQADVYLATGAGAAPAGVIAAVQAYINSRIPLMTTALVASAAPVNVTVDATLYVHNGFQVSALAQADTNLANYIGGLSIGGDTAYLSDIIAALQEPQGVRNVVVSLPTDDTVITAGQVAVLVASLIVVVVP